MLRHPALAGALGALLLATLLPSTASRADGLVTEGVCPALPSSSLASEPMSGVVEPGTTDCFELPATTSGPVLVRLESSVPTVPEDPDITRSSGTEALIYDADGRFICNVFAFAGGRCELDGPVPFRVVVGNDPDTTRAAYRLWVLDPDDRSGCQSASVAAPGTPPVTFDLAPHGASGCVALSDSSDQVLWSAPRDATVATFVLDGDAQLVCALPATLAQHLTEGCFFGEHPAPYTVMATNVVDSPRRARVLLRSDPAEEPGCSKAAPLGAAGPRPLTGTNTGTFGLTCHYVDFVAGDQLAVDRYHRSGRRLPGVWVYQPDGQLVCADQRPVEAWIRESDCGATVTGRYVVVVVGQRGTEGGYRVELGCVRDACPRDDTVIDLGGARPSGPVRVGQPLRAVGASAFPRNATIGYQWVVDGIIAGRRDSYRPRLDDVGRRLQLITTAMSPGRTAVARRGVERVIGLGQIELARGPAASETPRSGRVSQAYAPRLTTPVRGVSFGFRWLRDGEPVRGGSDKTYRVRTADRGHRLQVQVTVRASGYESVTVRTPSRLVR